MLSIIKVLFYLSAFAVLALPFSLDASAQSGITTHKGSWPDGAT
jgi:hypothetical protein